MTATIDTSVRSTLQLGPVTAALGAEVEGVDLAAPLSDETIA